MGGFVFVLYLDKEIFFNNIYIVNLIGELNIVVFLVYMSYQPIK